MISLWVCLFSTITALLLTCSLFLDEWETNPRFKSSVIASAKRFMHAPLQFAIVIVLDVYVGVHYRNLIVFLSCLNMIVVSYRVSEVLKHASMQSGVLRTRLNFMPELPAPF